ncbi:hypothetical protein [Streptomyces sp. NPDC060035]|uniref:hypothetical protein n=1 Tax=Streptomyces sp. NPDC060035 TaxID=3347044 RepID=UPI00369F771E
MNKHGRLADVLQALRGQLLPVGAGLTTCGGRRRVPGLRQGEPPMLAGIRTPSCARTETRTT